MRYLVALLSLIFISNLAEARCNDYYADHLIEKRFTGCDAGKLTDGIKGVKDWYQTCGMQVSDVCMGGCYDAIFREDLREECDRRYAKAIAPCEAMITEQAKKAGCKDEGKYLAPQSAADENCEWLTLYSATTECGGKEKRVCSGELYCSKDVKLPQGTIAGGKTFVTVCAAEEGKTCGTTSIQKCMVDETVYSSSDDQVKQGEVLKKIRNQKEEKSHE